MEDNENVRYTCGHFYHTACIFKTKLSIHNPHCPACNKGKLIYNQYKTNDVLAFLKRNHEDLDHLVDHEIDKIENNNFIVARGLKKKSSKKYRTSKKYRKSKLRRTRQSRKSIRRRY